MAQDRFLIAPYDTNSGLQEQVRPWLIPDEAFAELTNAYVFRGRVRKRFGSRFFNDNPLLSRLRVQIGTTAAITGNFAGTTPVDSGAALIVTPAIGQLFSIGTQVFTVVALGNPAPMLISGSATLATFDTTTGAVVINGADPLTAVYYYPALPVMGLRTYDVANLSNEKIIAFDTRFAYEYTTGWQRLAGETTPDASFWTGTDTQFFWTTTWSGANAADRIFFVTNFNENEANYMRTFDGTNWDNFRPPLTAANFLEQARILIPFKNRLLALNTWEFEGAGPTPINYQNRCRYSQIGSPLDVNAWREDIPGRGSGIDAPTMEAIVTVEFVKDRLIVFFERSTWELVYTGNQIYPFAWQQINTELGAESTFSIVPFDKVAIGVGNVGIHACNGTNVERIDDKIPDVVFAIHNQNGGVERVYGVRDFFVETIYWSLPDIARNADFPFPNRVLVFNYKTGTWAFNVESITAFGYYQPAVGTALWSATDITWQDEEIWSSGTLQALFRWVAAGNQEGFTFLIDADKTTNASALQITNIVIAAVNTLTITAIDHNLREGEFVYFEDIVGSGNMTLLNNKIFKVIIPIAADTFTIIYSDSVGSIIAGVYAGAGLISRVSNISIRTKQYNFYAKQARNASINKVDFMVDKTATGELDVSYYISTAQINLLDDGQSPPLGTGALVGTGTLETFAYTTIPYEATATRVWRPVYIQADGEVIELKISMNDTQMMDVDIRKDDFQLHAICFYTFPTAYGFR